MFDSKGHHIDFQKREVVGVNLRQRDCGWVDQFGWFDMTGPRKARIGYAE